MPAGTRQGRGGEPRIHDGVYALAAFHERTGLAGGDRNADDALFARTDAGVRPFDDASAK